MQLVDTLGWPYLGLITAAPANPVNLALSGTATQSSTYPWSPALGATMPLMAILMATFTTVCHAYRETKLARGLNTNQGWWQVDLLGMFELDQVVLWNRTDG